MFDLHTRRKISDGLIRTTAVLSTASLLLLCGCHNLFVCQKSSCPSSGGGTTSGSGDYLYVSNSTTSASSLAAYDISKGALTAISGSPFNLGYVPVALSVTPDDKFLYIASIPGATSPGVYLYSIGSNGVLTIGNGGAPVAADQISSIDVSPDGKYLFTVSVTGISMNEYQINSATGGLTLASAVTLPGFNCALTGSPASQSCTVKVSPSGQFVVVSVGTAGDAIFSYSSTSGLTSGVPTVIPSGTTASNPTGDFSVALDKSNFAFIARTSSLAVYSINAAGAAVLQGTASYGGSATPRSVTLSSGYNYVYTANEGGSTISEFSIGTTGALTPLSGSPVAAPTNVSALGVDKTGAYLAAAGYNSSSGVQLYTIGTTGALTPAASTGSGTSLAYPAVLALTH